MRFLGLDGCPAVTIGELTAGQWRHPEGNEKGPVSLDGSTRGRTASRRWIGGDKLREGDRQEHLLESFEMRHMFEVWQWCRTEPKCVCDWTAYAQ